MDLPTLATAREPSLVARTRAIAQCHAPAALHLRGSQALKLKLDRHDAAPGSKALPAGAEQHLVFVSLGRGYVELERGGEAIAQELTFGSVAVHPAGLPIRWSWRTPLSYSVLALDPKFLNDVACRIYGAAPGDFELLPTECSLDFRVAALLGTLGREAARGGPDRGLYLESLANVLAAHLLRHYGRWNRGGPPSMTLEANSAIQTDAGIPQPVQRAMRYIEQHHAEDIGLRDIAQAAHCSPYHLARTFKHSVGLPPHKYLIQVRVRSAHSLLSIGREKLSLAEVASASGFSDQSHLTRHFKRTLGVTPRQVIAATGHRPLSS